MCLLDCLSASTRKSGSELEAVLRHHEEMQEEIAQDMIEMAKSLRNNSLVAKKVILSDNEVCH